MDETRVKLFEVLNIKIETISKDLMKVRNWVQNSLITTPTDGNLSKQDQIDKEYESFLNELSLIKILNEMQIQLYDYMETRNINDDDNLNTELNLTTNNPFKTEVASLNSDNSCYAIDHQELYNKRCHIDMFLNLCDQNNLIQQQQPEIKVEIEDKKVWKGALKNLDLPEVGATIFILVTSSAANFDLCHFYVQKIEQSSNAIVNVACSLLDEINSEHVEENDNYEKYGSQPQDGEVVLIYHWSGKWMRARFMRLEPNGELRFFMVDFGEEYVTKLDNIRQIKEKFLQLPFQAIECWLHNYQMSSKTKISTAKDFFENFIMMKPFQAIVRGHKKGGLALEVRDCHGFDICLKLAEFGIVEPCKKSDAE